ncbi:Hypothetical predicted protein [Cloeon dipterum]|uniref:Uncharacterized protein n=1 Tax=Cloeon dipterum TaxID=197152 RepID=A0A8S1BZB2_9INSE|nr:Hypothetical predicted protein [Cloeon dipterum]
MGLFNCVGGCMLGIFRWGIFIVNIVNLLFGGAVIFFGIAILARLDIAGLEGIADADAIGVVLIIAGIFSVAVAFAGCFGTLKGSPTLMKMYAGVMFALGALNFLSAIFAFMDAATVGAGAVSMVVSVLELVAGIFSVLLSKTFKKKRIEEREEAMRRAHSQS